jgi:TPR repeat protein
MPSRQRAELFDLKGKPVDFKTIDLQQTYDAAESGDASAQFIASKIELGCYNTGVKHNKDNALILLEAGAEAGNEFCAVQLGVHLVSGFYSISGSPTSSEDIELANKYLRFNTKKIINHAERKSPYAQHILAQAYMYGIDTQTGSYNRGKASELSVFNFSNAILTSRLNAGAFHLAQKVWGHTEAWRNKVGTGLPGLPNVQGLLALLQ